MQQLYQKRAINSCYFDTQNFRMFHESEDGILPRRKIRFRWYNNQFFCSKETKISSIEGRYKIMNRENSINTNSIKFHRFFEKDYGITSINRKL